MDATEILLTVALVWVLIGSVLSFFMARRGHAAFTWWFVGAVLGPFALPLALFAVRREERERRVVVHGTPAGGPVDVLVGIDGSGESEAAARFVTEMLGSRLGRLTLATALDFEASASTRPWQSEEQARSALTELREGLPDVRPDVILLSGPPADALDRLAADSGYHLLVIGARGRHASKLLLGSVATQLARRASTPVLIART